MEEEEGNSRPETGFSALPDEQREDIVKRIVRFMLGRNVKGRPVRRAELSSHVFKQHPYLKSKHRIFNAAFEQAQHRFRSTFGMEIQEIQKLIKRSHASQSRSNTGVYASQGPGSGQGTKGYILASVLPMESRPGIPESLANIGFLTLLAALIALQPGCRIAEDTLHHTLSRLGVHVREKHGHKQLNGGNVKELLEHKFVDMWYLEKEKEDNLTYYRLGPRLRAELSDEDLLEFIHAMYKGGVSEHGLLDETGRNEIKARLEDAWGPDGPPEERE